MLWLLRSPLKIASVLTQEPPGVPKASKFSSPTLCCGTYLAKGIWDWKSLRDHLGSQCNARGLLTGLGQEGTVRRESSVAEMEGAAEDAGSFGDMKQSPLGPPGAAQTLNTQILSQ